MKLAHAAVAKAAEEAAAAKAADEATVTKAAEEAAAVKAADEATVVKAAEEAAAAKAAEEATVAKAAEEAAAAKAADEATVAKATEKAAAVNAAEEAAAAKADEEAAEEAAAAKEAETTAATKAAEEAVVATALTEKPVDVEHVKKPVDKDSDKYNQKVKDASSRFLAFSGKLGKSCPLGLHVGYAILDCKCPAKVTTPGFPCDICGFVSKTRHALRLHKDNRHNVITSQAGTTKTQPDDKLNAAELTNRCPVAIKL